MLEGITRRCSGFPLWHVGHTGEATQGCNPHPLPLEVTMDEEALALLKRALEACNTAVMFRFGVDRKDDSYKLAADIQRYLRREQE